MTDKDTFLCSLTRSDADAADAIQAAPETTSTSVRATPRPSDVAEKPSPVPGRQRVQTPEQRQQRRAMLKRMVDALDG